MSAAVIIPFPTVRRAGPYPRPHHHGRSTVRFVRYQQAKLPLAPPDETLDQRIAAAKATAGNYDELARAAQRPVTRAVYERLAATWERRICALIAERDRQTAQQELALPTVELPPCGHPHNP